MIQVGGSAATKAPATQQAPKGAAAGVTQAATAQAAGKAKVAEKAEWHMMTDEGEEFGPITKSELDSWVQEGRVDAKCQVLKDGWEQWKWADDVYPQLADGAQAAPSAENPFAGLGDAGPTADVPVVAPSKAPQTPTVQTAPTFPAASSGASGAGSPRLRAALAETRPWVLFLSILGLVLNGLGAFMVLWVIFVLTVAIGVGGLLLGTALLIGPGLWIAASFFLLQYGLRLGNYLRSGAAGDLDGAMVAQRSFWRFLGIVVLVILVLYLVVFVMTLALGGIAALTAGPAL